MQALPEAPRLGLASHVRACACDGQVILLDLRRSRYLGIGSEASKVLGACVDNWPLERPRLDGPTSRAPINKLVQQLLSQGLLTPMPTGLQVGSAKDGTVDEATGSLDFEDLVTSVRISAGRLSRFLRCSATASLRLRLQTLQLIAASLADRKARLDRPSCTWETLKESAIAFEKLRPFVFSARSKCLYDSLAMIEFLAAEGKAANWVIGVTTAPFGAHAWVQSGSIVLNDQHENVRRFRPILVV